MKRCQNCRIRLLGTSQGDLCPACEAWVNRGDPPACRVCGKVADPSELIAWEARRGFGQKFGAGRYLCRECRVRLGLTAGGEQKIGSNAGFKLKDFIKK